MTSDNRFLNRRSFFQTAATGVVGAALGASLTAEPAKAQWEVGPATESGARRGNLIGVSSYSFWHFDEDVSAPMDQCLQKAAEMGFDAFEVLEQQLDRTDLPYLCRRTRPSSASIPKNAKRTSRRRCEASTSRTRWEFRRSA